MKKQIGKAVRILTIPPLLFLLLVIFIYLARRDVFHSAMDLAAAIICLAVLPALAYPLQPCIPHFKDKGREGQRNLAMYLTALGYLLGAIYGRLMSATVRLQLVFDTYLISVILLLIFNKVFSIKASGHSCSITGCCVFLYFYTGVGIYSVFMTGVLLLVYWASLNTKRHSFPQLLSGSGICAAGFFMANLLLDAV
jgi:hypothetical protein